MRGVTTYAWCLVCAVLAGGLQRVAAQDRGGERVPERPPEHVAATTDPSEEARVWLKSMLAKSVTVDVQQAAMSRALRVIAGQSGVQIVYERTVVDAANKSVTVHATQASLGAVLDRVLAGTNLQVVALPGTGLGVVSVKDSVTHGTGTILGTVTDATTQRPVVSATVTIGDRVARTNEAGAFRIGGVAVGTQRVAVRRLGYNAATKLVDVTSEGTATVTFALGPATTVLNDVVTTATGEQSRLEVGNSIGTIKADSIVPTTLIRNVSDLLQARIPGLVVSNTQGEVGAPSRIRIRGVNSLRLNNDPIVIVDGVRIVSQTTQAASQTTIAGAGIAGGVGGQDVLVPSRLDDIDPNSIESIDVLKGPSATSLYGTDAANGVIVIKTKRGHAGPLRLSVLADDGWSYIPGQFPGLWFGWGHLPNGAPIVSGSSSGVPGCLLISDAGLSSSFSHPSVADGTCTQDSVTAFNPENDANMRTLGTGRSQNLSATLSGGSDHVQNAVTLNGSNQLGLAKMSDVERRRILRVTGGGAPSYMAHPNTLQQYGGTSRTSYHTVANTDLDLSTMGLYNTVRNGGSGMPPTTITAATPVSPRDTLRYTPTSPVDQETSARRGLISGTANTAPWRWLSFHAAVGGDYTQRNDNFLLDCSNPAVVAALSPLTASECQSSRQTTRDEAFQRTVDVGTELKFTPSSWLGLNTAIGEQYTDVKSSSLMVGNAQGTQLAFGTTLLSPLPISPIGDDGLFSVSEGRDEGATAGWYLEQRAALRERLFLTAGFRKDVSSAFGRATNHSAPTYPKFSASWLVSDEPFFPKFAALDNLRLRAAYGHSGQQASQFDVISAYSTVDATSPDGSAVVPGIVLSQLGNAALKPERTREAEGGFDVSFFNNERVHLEATVYRKLTTDAILVVTLPGSYGVTTGDLFQSPNLQQSVNVGSVENRGVELSLTARLIDTRSLGWDVTVNRSQNTNKLVHKDPSVSQFGSFNTQIREGYPIFGYWGQRLLSYDDRNGDGVLSSNEVTFDTDTTFFGPGYPTAEMTYLNTISLFDGQLRISTNIDQIIGQTTYQSITASAREAVDPATPLALQATALEGFHNGAYIRPVSSVRLSELSVTYSVSPSTARRLLHAQSASVTVAGRNLGLWTHYHGKDPNIDTSSSFAFGEVASDNGSGVPQPRDWTLRLNLGF